MRFVEVATLDGNAILYAPAPQTVDDDSRPVERLFAPTSPQPVPEASVEERLGKEIRFDPDVWIVETEDRAGRHFLDPGTELIFAGESFRSLSFQSLSFQNLWSRCATIAVPGCTCRTGLR